MSYRPNSIYYLQCFVCDEDLELEDKSGFCKACGSEVKVEWPASLSSVIIEKQSA